jgi:hypothetical protein
VYLSAQLGLTLQCGKADIALFVFSYLFEINGFLSSGITLA